MAAMREPDVAVALKPSATLGQDDGTFFASSMALWQNKLNARYEKSISIAIKMQLSVLPNAECRKYVCHAECLR
jgi:hypothetical protein